MLSSNIRDAVIDKYGPKERKSAEDKATIDQGFIEGVKRKHPLLIAATIEELYAKRSSILESLR